MYFFNVAIKMNHSPAFSCTELNQWRHAEFLYFRMNSSKKINMLLNYVHMEET